MTKSLVLLGVLLLMFGCSNKEIPTLYLADGIKNAFENETGSYWIFKDSITGDIDSVYIRSTKKWIDEGAISNSGNSVEKLLISYSSVHFGTDTSLNNRLSIFYEFSNFCNGYISAGVVAQGHISASCNYPMVDAYSKSPDPDTIISSGSTTYTISGTETEQVRVFNQIRKNAPNTANIGYWSNKLGFVKFRFRNDTARNPLVVLELVRYKIVKRKI